MIESLLVATSDALETSKILELLKARFYQLNADVEDTETALDSEQLREIDELASLKLGTIEQAIQDLNSTYEATGRSFRVIDTAFGWKLFTTADYAPYVEHLYPDAKPRKLSPSAMETLSIIAYRQPMTKAAVESIRGVSADAMIHKLLDEDLVKITGRSDLPGRPLLYQTTDFFLDHFGLRHLDELPKANELRIKSENTAGTRQMKFPQIQS